ncbi:hypothetical protein SAMN02745221_00201 [Thermosyntropha lipolytica DSM 11003]|uniref:Uncharacterized protein n=1 Tax=Thermosyntropha lipolytica DSM 11003 TaxID=1123382 RepID=A0A1M5JRS1_9FIRM|nr:hypothetical protein [Thermosyntropha lipolytica]SHG43218.1 hypothetical protein SAMN02745221_00201 [Thermosyntropha lipolytica DSM 11003]
MLYLVITMVITFAILEIKKIREERSWKDLLVALFLILAAFLYSIEIHFNLSFLPNPNRILFFVKPAGDAFMKLLGLS